MEHNYQNIIKKNYAKPVIEEVMIDVAINLNTPTTDPNPDDPPWGDDGSEGTGDVQGVSSYEPATFKSTSSPFPDSPKY